MFDLVLTILLIIVAYKGYQWYTKLQAQVKAGPKPPPEVEPDLDLSAHPQPGDENDYIDYEEIKK